MKNHAVPSITFRKVCCDHERSGLDRGAVASRPVLSFEPACFKLDKGIPGRLKCKWKREHAAVATCGSPC